MLMTSCVQKPQEQTENTNPPEIQQQITLPEKFEILYNTRSYNLTSSENALPLIDVAYNYPTLDNTIGYDYIDTVNAELKKAADDLVASAEGQTENAQRLLDEKGEDYNVMSFDISFREGINRNGLLSFSADTYKYMGEGNPTDTAVSYNYDMKNGKKLALSDILKGSAKEIEDMVVSLFSEAFEEIDKAQLKAEAKNVKFCLTEQSLILYFDVYQVAPYAFGTPEIEFPYNDTDFKLDL